MPTEEPTPSPVVTLVESEGCHLCDEAGRVLEDLVVDGWDLVVDLVDAYSPEGVRLLQVHRPAMSPLVLVDGGFFSQGRLPRGKLLRLLASREAGRPRVGA